MESCSQNHFKIFFKLLIFFFLVLLTLQNCTVPPWACTNTAQGPSLLAFAFGVYHSVTNNQRCGIKWEHCELSSPHVLYVLCMYIYIIFAAKRVRWHIMGWGESGANLRERKCFNFS